MRTQIWQQPRVTDVGVKYLSLSQLSTRSEGHERSVSLSLSLSLSLTHTHTRLDSEPRVTIVGDKSLSNRFTTLSHVSLLTHSSLSLFMLVTFYDSGR
jgi:hypothetical protein